MLNDARVRYLVVGGLAVNVHGLLRTTADIDVVVQLDSENVARALAALDSLGYRPTVPVSAAEFGDAETRERWVREKNMRVLRFHSNQHPETPVDVFASEPFVFDDEYERAAVREIVDVGDVRVVSLSTLIRMKQEAGRQQDLVDLDNLKLRNNRHE